MEKSNLPESLQTLIRSIENSEKLTPGIAKRLLEDANIESHDLMPWADFNHPIADSYGRKLVYDGKYFELMVMSWVDGDMSAIHDHGYTQWGAVQLFGPAEHAFFKLDNNILITRLRSVCQPREVLAVGHDLIHQMGNAGNEPYLTLHLYGSYDFKGCVTADARLYDLDEGKIQFTSGGVFFDLPEDQINRRIDGPKSDFPTLLRCKVELLKRLLRKNGSFEKERFGSEDEARIANELFEKSTWEMLYNELNASQNRSEEQQARYKAVLDQELYTTANLQLAMLNSGIIKHGFDEFRNELPGMLMNGHSQDFSISYLDFMSWYLGAKNSLASLYAA